MRIIDPEKDFLEEFPKARNLPELSKLSNLKDMSAKRKNQLLWIAWLTTDKDSALIHFPPERRGEEASKLVTGSVKLWADLRSRIDKLASQWREHMTTPVERAYLVAVRQMEDYMQKLETKKGKSEIPPGAAVDTLYKMASNVEKMKDMLDDESGETYGGVEETEADLGTI